MTNRRFTEAASSEIPAAFGRFALSCSKPRPHGNQLQTPLRNLRRSLRTPTAVALRQTRRPRSKRPRQPPIHQRRAPSSPVPERPGRTCPSDTAKPTPPSNASTDGPGRWQAIFEALQQPDLEWIMLDTTVVRAHQHAAGQKKVAPKPRRSDAHEAVSRPRSTPPSMPWATPSGSS